MHNKVNNGTLNNTDPLNYHTDVYVLIRKTAYNYFMTHNECPYVPGSIS